MPPILRVPADPGYLSNKRMALEIAIGLAHLSGRTLSLPIDEPIGWGPRPARPEHDSGPASSLRDLYEVPVPVVEDPGPTGHSAVSIEGDDLTDAVFVDPPDLVDRSDFEAFANGRRVLGVDPAWTEAPVVDVPRTLAHYSYFFFLDDGPRQELFDLLELVRPRAPYRDLGRALADDLGDFNAAHIRRTDFLVGVRDARRATPRMLRDTLAERFRADVPLVVCTEADPESDVFVPLRTHFAEVVFLSQHVLEAERARFDALPRHDDSALALVSQEVATRATGFAGTLGSTFTGIIHRQRCLLDPAAPFWFTADFLAMDGCFRAGEYLASGTGPYSWNRIDYPLAASTLAWFREWPEVASAPRC